MFDAMGLTMCVACHGNHAVMRTSDDRAGTGGKALCVNCHDATSAGFAQAAATRSVLDVTVMRGKGWLGRVLCDK